MKNASCHGLIMVMLIAAGGTAMGVTNYVDASATGDNTGTNWPNAYTNLNDGLAGAVSPDQIWVAQGTYYPGTGQTDSFTMKAGVNLYGGFTNGMTSLNDRNWQTYKTILDGASNNYHVVYCAQSLTFDGFIIQNGLANSTNDGDRTRGAGWFQGGGQPTIQNCTFQNNICTNSTSGQASLGGAIYAVWSVNMKLYNCVFTNNHCQGNWVGDGGGAVAHWGNPEGWLTISNCTFVDNTSKSGGGAVMIWKEVEVTIVGSTFITNRCLGNEATWGRGGAVEARTTKAVSMTVSNSTFSRNQSRSHGGAIGFVVNAGTGSIDVANCTFSSNSCVDSGGSGVYLASKDTDDDLCNAVVRNCKFIGGQANAGYGALEIGIRAGSTATVENCEFYRNSANYGSLAWTSAGTGTVKQCLFAGNIGSQGGGGLYFTNGNLLVENCTIASNYAANGSGILNTNTASNIVIKNCIIWGNTGGTQIVNYVAGPTIAYTDIPGGMGGIGPTTMTDGGGNIEANPLLVNLAGGNYRLQANSPCINAGTNMSWMTNAYDLDRKTRIRYGTVDMGAYETIYDGTLFKIQ